VITGTLPGACYAAGMTSFLNARHIRIFDYPRFAEPLRDRIREAAQALATAQGARIEHVAKAHIRKEDLVAAVLKDRGDHPGLVHVLSAMEACDAYEPWHDKPSHQTFLRHTSGKCLHYYFYWMDETLGLIYLRVPTWSPFRLQFYCNGHSRLAHSLTTAGIDYAMADNAFIRITDWERAQQLADAFSPDTLHALLDHYAEQCCPILDVFGQSYHWSLMQVEYSTDLSSSHFKPMQGGCWCRLAHEDWQAWAMKIEGITGYHKNNYVKQCDMVLTSKLIEVSMIFQAPSPFRPLPPFPCRAPPSP
jgi:hypothetical protein